MYHVYRLPHAPAKPPMRCATLAGARAYAAAQKHGGDIFDRGGWCEAWRAGSLVGFMEGTRWLTADAQIARHLAQAVAA